MDKLVIDIETSNTFADVGGRQNLKQLDVSLVGIYSYNKDKYISFTEHELEPLGKLLQTSSLIIGFAINRFDIPVLDKYYNFNLFAAPRLDILEEIELACGKRISLNILAEANLGTQKTGHGLEAVTLYHEGKMKELRDYCLMDVKITKDLYELVQKQGFLVFPDKMTNEEIKVPLEFPKEEISARLF